MTDVREWLESIGFGQYVDAFVQNDIDGELLRELLDADLVTLGISSLGHRKRLLRAIAALGSEGREDDSIASGAPASSDRFPSEPERRQLTVMFCDLVGSVALGERLDVEDYRKLLGRFRTAVSVEIERYEGFVARHHGDGLLVYFGYPQAHEDDAERAVRAALAIVESIEDLDRESEPDVQVRVGIATGPAVVGDVLPTGASERAELAALGPTPNLAARLQATTEPNAIVVSDVTERLAGPLFRMEHRPVLGLKGIEAPVTSFRVVGELDVQTRSETVGDMTKLSPLVGRHGELGLILGRWQQARQGSGQAVLVAAEAGVGKSRLVREVRRSIGEQDFWPVTLYCSPYHTGSALYPVIETIGRTLGFQTSEDTGTRLAKLRSWATDLGITDPDERALIASLLSIPADTRDPISELPADTRRERTLQTLGSVVEKLARQRPVLLVAEDLHWSDPTTLEFLGMLLERMRGSRILALFTFRPEFSAPWKDHALLTSLTLNHLTPAESRQLATHLARHHEISEALLEQIVFRTDGVPLFVEEIARGLAESADVKLTEENIPATLRDALTARLDRLGPAKEVAQLASVVGRRFSLAVLDGLTSLGPGELGDALHRLVSSGLVFERGPKLAPQYEFKHVLVQEAAYESLLKETRRERHRQVAEILEHDYPEICLAQPELLAHHYTAAQLLEDALRYWHLAGRRAGEQSAHRETVKHVRSGIGILRNLPVTPERQKEELELQILLGAALQMVAGQTSDEVEVVYLRAEALDRDLGCPAYSWPIFFGLWRLNISRSRIDEAQRFGQELARRSKAGTDPLSEAARSLVEGVTAHYSGAPGKALAELETLRGAYTQEALDTVTLRVGMPVRLSSLFYSALASWLAGFPERSQTLMDEAMGTARDQRRPYELATVLAFGGLYHAVRHEPAKALMLAEECLRLSTENHFPVWRALSLWIRGWCKAMAGEVEPGIEDFRSGQHELAQRHTRLMLPLIMSLLAEAYEVDGLSDQALLALREGHRQAAESGERWWEGELLRQEAELLLADARESRQGEALLVRAIELTRAQGAKSLELRAALSAARHLRAVGRADEASGVLSPVVDSFTEGLGTHELRQAKALLDELSP